MAEVPGKLVVRPHAPLRQALGGVGLAVVAIVALYAVYELGRFDAGYDRQAVVQERRSLRIGRPFQ